MAKKPAPAEPAAPAAVAVPVAGGRVGVVLRSVVDRVQGARLCYGDPVTADGRTVIPVARVSGVGGMGFGDDGRVDGGTGGGGGGRLDATPVGYIELTAEGTRWIAIPDETADARMVRAVTGGLGGMAVMLAIARRLRRR